MNKIFFVFFLFLFIQGCSDTQQDKFPKLTGSYLGQKPPGMTPEVFAPVIVSTEHHEHSAPTFSPDGREIYWSVFFNKKPPQVILYMKVINGQWSKPAVAEFSGKFSDGSPFISPVGKRLFFESDRPVNKNDTVKNDPDIWMVERSGSRWGKPVHLGSKVNSLSFDSSPSVSMNGNLYFLSERNASFGKHDIYYSKFDNGNYTYPVNLGDKINTEDYEDYPFIAKDESYILFCGSNRKDGFGLGDLYISFKNSNGDWENPINLGNEINSTFDDRFPAVSPDNKYLFFVSDRSGNSDIYWVDAKVINVLRPKK